MAAEHEVIEAEVIEEVEDAPARTQLVRREQVGGLLRPVAQPQEVLAVQNETRKLVAEALEDGRDYGVIPGTNKPTMFKAGAERVNAAFGTYAQYSVLEREIDHDYRVHYQIRSWKWGQAQGEKVWSTEEGESFGLYRYVLKCQLVHRASGVIIGEGVGSCSSMEPKYVRDPRSAENTVLKMAKKRAYVDATLSTFGLSDQFTQDVEDMGSVPGGSDAPFSLDDKIPFGKHSGKTWAEIVAAEPDYVSWAIANMDKLSPDAKRILAEALEDHDMKGAEREPDGPPVKAPNGNGSAVLTCPKCGESEMWDNRRTKKGKQPDLKCKDRNCGHAIWMDSWEKSLSEEIGAAHQAQAIDAHTRDQMEGAVIRRDPGLMLRVQAKLNELAQEAGA